MSGWSPDRASSRVLRSGRAGLNPDALISRSWARHLWNVSGRDGTVEYAVNARGRGHGNLPMSAAERRFIHGTFARLDRITGLTFEQASSGSAAEIRVNCARSLGGSDGLAVRRGRRFDLYWKDQKGWTLTAYEQHVIRHEIGHALGLDHPRGRGSHPRYDSRDTVMSYNWRGNTGFTATDVLTLQQLWGA